jgi:hypothetical protein
MAGMSRHTGKRLDELAHIRQSVADILTTPIGSRVMRREYGSRLPELIDQPLTGATLLRAYAATTDAIIRWEPRIKVRAITRLVHTDRPGAVTLGLNGVRTDSGEAFSMEVPLSGGGA